MALAAVAMELPAALGEVAPEQADMRQAAAIAEESAAFGRSAAARGIVDSVRMVVQHWMALRKLVKQAVGQMVFAHCFEIHRHWCVRRS